MNGTVNTKLMGPIKYNFLTVSQANSVNILKILAAYFFLLQRESLSIMIYAATY